MTIFDITDVHAGVALAAAAELSAAELLIDHPLVVGIPVRTTPADQATLECKRIAAAGGPAFTLVGEPGSGRKCAARLIAAHLYQDFRQLPVLQHALPRIAPGSTRERWQALMFSLGNHNVSVRGNALLKARSIQTILDIARRKGSFGTILMTIHNFECLDALWASMLLDLRDAVCAEGYRLFFLNVANSSYLQQAQFRLLGSNTAHEVPNLIGSPCALRHLSSLDDFTQLFSELDTSYFPTNSDCSWFAFYLPRAYRSGLRLQACATDFHSAYLEFCEDNGRSSVSTRGIFNVIRLTLTRQSLEDKEGFKLDKAVWRHAFDLAASSYPSGLVLANEARQ